MQAFGCQGSLVPLRKVALGKEAIATDAQEVQSPLQTREIEEGVFRVQATGVFVGIS